MALITCSECGKEIFDKALECPGCGNPISTQFEPVAFSAPATKKRPKKQYICTICGTVGKPVNITQGSILIEIVLWIMLIVPGLVYSIWRLTTKTVVCPECKNATMISTDSPIGRKLLSEQPTS